MSQPLRAMARTSANPAASEHAWRVVAADGSVCAIDGAKALGITRPQPVGEPPECQEVKPTAEMPATGVELGEFVTAARKTGLYRRAGDEPAAAPAKAESLEDRNARPALPKSLPPQRSAEVWPEAAGLLYPTSAGADDECAATACPKPAFLADTDPNLARVVRLWPGLPLGIQAGILAMVEATIAENAYTQP